MLEELLEHVDHEAVEVRHQALTRLRTGRIMRKATEVRLEAHTGPRTGRILREVGHVRLQALTRLAEAGD